MPPRKTITSPNAVRAERKLKRAIKRGDVERPEPSTSPKLDHSERGRVRILRSEANLPGVESSRKLQSSFIKLSSQFLEVTQALASTLVLPRPIPAETAIFASFSAQEGAKVDEQELACPVRPKWRFDMTKEEVKSNEEAVYATWLDETDDIVRTWQNASASHPNFNQDDNEVDTVEPPTDMPRSATYFERNLEVWRQLWRVTEISQIILVLLDARCPLLHYPPSLHSYLSNRPDLRVVLVLTKVDLSGRVRADAWEAYFHSKYPNIRVVQVETYGEKVGGSRQQGQKTYEPRLSDSFRQRLVQTIREVHAEMLQPPQDSEKWKPPVRQDINWTRVLEAGGETVGSVVGGLAVREADLLTIGVIGQPNVGKSSLLNALFNTQKVSASKTPGKTKHFQTLFWTPDVRLVDCPGLVMPNFVPMEMQVLAGILPISRVSAIPSCIHHAAKLIPLERVYELAHPILSEPPVEDKRTWRADHQAQTAQEGRTNPPWHAMDVLTAYADAKGWVTAKAGRSDVKRAGNALLRSLAEGNVSWAFWPPGTDPSTVSAEAHDVGIWIPHMSPADSGGEHESENENEQEYSTSSQNESEPDEDLDVGKEEAGSGGVGGMFPTLTSEFVHEEEAEA